MENRSKDKLRQSQFVHTKNNPSLYDVHPAFTIRSTSASEGFVILLNSVVYLTIYDLKCYVRYYLEQFEQFEIMINNVISCRATPIRKKYKVSGYNNVLIFDPFWWLEALRKQRVLAALLLICKIHTGSIRYKNRFIDIWCNKTFK